MKSIRKNSKCKCFSGKEYQYCCEPFHEGILPSTALELMRSRYSAYAYGLVDYIMETTHPENEHFKMDDLNWRNEIISFCNNFQFLGLSILDSAENWVIFNAHITQAGKDFSFTEKSSFEKIDDRWFYKSGKIS